MLFIKANSRHSDTPEAFKRIVSHDGVDGHKKLQYYKWLINVCLCVMHRKQRVICLIRWWRLDGWWTTQPRGHHNKHVQEIWKTENNIFHVLSPIVTKYVCVVDGIEIGGDLPWRALCWCPQCPPWISAEPCYFLDVTLTCWGTVLRSVLANWPRRDHPTQWK